MEKNGYLKIYQETINLVMKMKKKELLQMGEELSKIKMNLEMDQDLLEYG